MKKIMLLGDSIRKSYCQQVSELLEGKAEVLWPDDNCRFSTYTLFYANQWAPDDDYDIIQWNNGQWDTARLVDDVHVVPLEQYIQTQLRIVKILQPRTKRLVFALTTPVHEDMLEKATVNGRCNEDICAYNKAAAEALAPLGVEILDLYSPVHAKLMEYVSEDRVHLTPTGVDSCAQIVADNFMK